MTAIHEIQFYSGALEYRIGDFVSNVNLNYHRLINCYPVKMPFLNIGHQQFFTSNKREHGDKQNIALRKRKGFEKCLEYEDSYFTDVIDFEGERYAIAKTGNGKDKTILKQCGAMVDLGCEHILSESACDGDWKVVGNFEDNICGFDKFTKTIGPIGKSKFNLCNIYIGHKVVGTAVISYAYALSNVGDRIDLSGDMNPGDWLYVYDSNGSNAVSGQMLQISNFDTTDNTIYFGEKYWIGVAQDVTGFPSDTTEITQGPVCAKLFEKVGSSLVVAALDGLYQLNDADCLGSSEWTLMGQTTQPQGNVDNIITAVVTINGGLVIMNKHSISFMRAPSFVNQNLFGTIYSTVIFDEEWDTMTRVQDYIILMGPRSMGIAYKSSYNFNTINGQTNPNYEYETLLKDMGYFSKQSILSFQEKFYFVTNSIEQQGARFYRLVLNVGSTGTKPIFGFDLDDMSNHWVNTDFMSLNKARGDTVSLSKNDFDILIFMNDNKKTVTENVSGTKILVYDDRFKFWHRWYTCIADMRGRAANVWYGKCLWTQRGDRDEGQPVKQMISMTFGDTSYYTMKNLAYLKMGLGHNSRISKDTIYSVYCDSGGIMNITRTDMLYSIAYVQRLNRLYKSGMSDDIFNIGRRNLVAQTPIGRGIYAGNGVGMAESQNPMRLREDIAYYCNYETNQGFNGIDCDCNDINVPTETDEEGCQLIPVKPFEDQILGGSQNFSSDIYADVHYMSKYVMTKRTLGKQGHLFTFEIVAHGDDEIEFLGWFIGYEFMDNTMEHMDNTVVFESTPEITKMSGIMVEQYLE